MGRTRRGSSSCRRGAAWGEEGRRGGGLGMRVGWVGLEAGAGVGVAMWGEQAACCGQAGCGRSFSAPAVHGDYWDIVACCGCLGHQAGQCLLSGVGPVSHALPAGWAGPPARHAGGLRVLQDWLGPAGHCAGKEVAGGQRGSPGSSKGSRRNTKVGLSTARSSAARE